MFMTQTSDHGGRVLSVARSLGITPEEISDFSASINPLGLPPAVRPAVYAAFDRLVHYPDSDCAELAEALARRHGVEPVNICVGNGSTELIFLLPHLAKVRKGLLIA